MNVATFETSIQLYTNLLLRKNGLEAIKWVDISLYCKTPLGKINLLIEKYCYVGEKVALKTLNSNMAFLF